MSIRIEKAGLLTMIQDLGRFGHQKFGVAVGGAMDGFALRAANILVGNEEGAPALEITLAGPTIKFQEAAVVAVCGADLAASVDGQALPMWRPVYIEKGSILSFISAISGCRAYLAAAGGFNVPMVLGSYGTFLRAGFGGYQGRALQSGDIVHFGLRSEEAEKRINQLRRNTTSSHFAAPAWFVSSDLLPRYDDQPIIRVMKGREYDRFTEDSKAEFFSQPFEVTLQSDRMGYRLRGVKLKFAFHREMISEAVTAGTVQVPPEGDPIVLMADRQTTGGYPRIAQIAAVDLPIMAQVRPETKVIFREITLREAQALLLLRELEIQILKQGISCR